MVATLSLAAASSTFGLFSSYYKHFNPLHSPYLLGGILCVASLSFISELGLFFQTYLLLFFPVGGTFLLLSILCFFYDPSKAGATTSDAVSEDSIKELDQEFKFSRTLCLASGIALITLLFFQTRASSNIFFWISYSACIVHLAIFLAYITVRNLTEEPLTNRSLFQIAFFTIAALSGLIVLGANIASKQPQGLLYTCETEVRYTLPSDTGESSNAETWNVRIAACSRQAIDQQFTKITEEITKQNPTAINIVKAPSSRVVSSIKFTFWYFIGFFALFEFFWLRKLVDIFGISSGMGASVFQKSSAVRPPEAAP